MARLAKTCLCLFFLIASAGPCVGQEDDPPPPPAKQPTRYVMSAEEWVMGTTEKVKVSFNEATGGTRAYVNLPKVASVPGRGIDVTLGFSSEARAAKTLWFVIEFTADAESFGSVAGHAVVVESDGQEFDIGNAFANEPTAKDASRVVMKKTMLYDPFVRAFGGKRIGIRLGSYSFRLEEDDLAAVRYLIKLAGKR